VEEAPPPPPPPPLVPPLAPPLAPLLALAAETLRPGVAATGSIRRRFSWTSWKASTTLRPSVRRLDAAEAAAAAAVAAAAAAAAAPPSGFSEKKGLRR
jgi:hypothetical protein